MDKKELLERVRKLDRDGGEKTMLQRAKMVLTRKLPTDRNYTEEDLELVKAWLANEIMIVQMNVARGERGEVKGKSAQGLYYAAHVLKHFYLEGRIKIE